MTFNENVWNKARKIKADIVLPESLDERIQKASSMVFENGLVNRIFLIGDPDKIVAVSKDEGIDISKAEIINHIKEKNFDDFAKTYFELRKHKGITYEDAVEKMKDPINYGAMMVKKGQAGGMVAGADHSTGDIIRAAITIVGLKEGVKTASSSFVMILPDKSFGFDGQMIFADCATVPSPDADQLAEIAITSAETGKMFIGFEPIIAMLSFSTKGSAKHESVDKVIEAVRIVKERRPDLIIDGELQLDAAVVENVAKKKCPDSQVRGKANVLIFPDLNTGNISYKLVQRFAKAEAYGPILQGFLKPVNDLSRGCFAHDIVNVIAITAVQSSQN